MGDIAPEMAELTDEVLFGDIWERPSSPSATGAWSRSRPWSRSTAPTSFDRHLALARRNGLTEAELVEAITHLAFYSGWPNAVSAVGVAREVFRSGSGAPAPASREDGR